MGYAHNFIIMMEKKILYFSNQHCKHATALLVVAMGGLCVCVCGLISTLQAIKYNSFFRAVDLNGIESHFYLNKNQEM